MVRKCSEINGPNWLIIFMIIHNLIVQMNDMNKMSYVWGSSQFWRYWDSNGRVDQAESTIRVLEFGE